MWNAPLAASLGQDPDPISLTPANVHTTAQPRNWANGFYPLGIPCTVGTIERETRPFVPDTHIESVVAPSSRSTVTVEHGGALVELFTQAGDGASPASGKIVFSGANCATGSCRMAIESVVLDGDDFSLDGTSVGSPFVVSTTVGKATYNVRPGESFFVLDEGTLRIVASGEASPRRGVSATNEGFRAFGNLFGRLFVFQQNMTIGDNFIVIRVSGTVNNFAPYVTMPPAIAVECSQPGAAHVVLEPVVEDADASGLLVAHWLVDGTVVQSSSSTTLESDLSLGSHVAELIVIDRDGGYARKSIDVEVVDTQPPTFAADPICLWPPNHYLILFTS